MIFALAQDILEAMVARFAANDRALPDYRFVTSGEVAWDCELAAVSYMGMTHALPGESSGVILGPVPQTVLFHLWVVRCVPVSTQAGVPPSIDEMNAAGNDAMTDGLLLGREVVKAYRAGEFSTTCDNVILTSQNTQGPEGGFLGLRQELLVQL